MKAVQIEMDDAAGLELRVGQRVLCNDHAHHNELAIITDLPEHGSRLYLVKMASDEAPKDRYFFKGELTALPDAEPTTAKLGATLALALATVETDVVCEQIRDLLDAGQMRELGRGIMAQHDKVAAERDALRERAEAAERERDKAKSEIVSIRSAVDDLLANVRSSMIAMEEELDRSWRRGR